MHFLHPIVFGLVAFVVRFVRSVKKKKKKGVNVDYQLVTVYQIEKKFEVFHFNIKCKQNGREDLLIKQIDTMKD